MEKEIVCVVLSSDNKLEKVGVINPESGDKKLSREIISVAEVMAEMKEYRTKFYFLLEDGKKVYMEIFNDRVLRTSPDGRYAAELKDLRNCRVKS